MNYMHMSHRVSCISSRFSLVGELPTPRLEAVVLLLTHVKIIVKDMARNSRLHTIIGVSLLAIVSTITYKDILRTIQTISSKIFFGFSLVKLNDTDSQITVSKLFVHPVKSLRPVDTEKVKLDRKGIVNDRRFIIVAPRPKPLSGSFAPGEATYRFLTQRQCPSLATVNASLVDGEIFLSSSLLPSLSAKIASNPDFSANTYLSRIWNDTVKLVDMGDIAAKFLHKVFDRDKTMPSVSDVRLAKQATDDRRIMVDKFCPSFARYSIFGQTPSLSMTDEFHILIANYASLEALNERLVKKGKAPIAMSNFRPNIVVTGCPAFDEDSWKVIRIGEAIFHVVKGCPRCKQSCINQVTGEVSKEPLETLLEFRNLTGDKENVFFAQSIVVDPSSVGKSISIGAQVEVLQRGEPVWL